MLSGLGRRGDGLSMGDIQSVREQGPALRDVSDDGEMGGIYPLVSRRGIPMAEWQTFRGLAWNGRTRGLV